MIYARIKGQEAQKRLENALKASKAKNWYRRLQVILNSGRGVTVEQLSKIFGLCEQTIRNYIRMYNENGLAKLKPKKSSGRPTKIGHWKREDWDRVLEQTPNQYEKLATESRQWTFERLSLYLKEYHGIEVTISSVYNSLRKTGRGTGRSKLRVGSPDPDYQVKRDQLKEVQNLPLRDN